MRNYQNVINLHNTEHVTIYLLVIIEFTYWNCFLDD